MNVSWNAQKNPTSHRLSVVACTLIVIPAPMLCSTKPWVNPCKECKGQRCSSSCSLHRDNRAIQFVLLACHNSAGIISGPTQLKAFTVYSVYIFLISCILDAYIEWLWSLMYFCQYFRKFYLTHQCFGKNIAGMSRWDALICSIYSLATYDSDITRSWQSLLILCKNSLKHEYIWHQALMRRWACSTWEECRFLVC